MDFWLVTTEYPPFFGGGIATYCIHTAQMLTEAGHAVTIIVGDSSLQSRERVEMNGPVRVVRFKAGDHPIFTQLGWSTALSYQISDLIADLVGRYGKPAVVEFQDCSAIGYWTIQRKLTGDQTLRDLFVCIHTHTPSSFLTPIEQRPMHTFPHFWVGEMERFCLSAADLVTVPSALVLRKLKAFGFKFAQDVALVRNPFLAQGQKTAVDCQATRELVYFGRIQQLKGVPRLLAAMRHLWADGLDIPLRLVGGDTIFTPKQRSMQALLTERYADEIDRGLVRFEGLVEPNNLATTIGRPLAVVFSSVFDNFPYAVIESMAAGLIMITSDNCGCHEIINHEKDGWLCDFDRPETLASAIRMIAELSASTRLEISKGAARAVERNCGYEVVREAKLSAIERAKRKYTRRRIFPFARDIESDTPAIPRPATQDHIAGMVSVIVPYYNMGDWIGETLDSLSSSSYSPMEVIVVDDGSTDESSISTLHDLQKRNWPFELHVVRKKNGGLASARNFGAQHARGEFLAILDADDLVTPEYYASAIDLLRQYDNVHFVGCWVALIGGNWGPLWITWNPEPPLFLYTNRINSSALVFRTEAFRHAGLNDPKMEYGLEDWEAVINMLAAGLRGIAIPKPLFRYRMQRQGSMLQNLSLDARLYLYQVISRKHARLFAEHATDVVGLLNCNGPWVLSSCPTWDHPPIGYWKGDGTTIDVDSKAIPIEIRLRLANLWQSQAFRSAVRLFFVLRVDQLLHRLAKFKRRNRNAR